MMTTLLLNLPNQQRIQRRYMCSYNAPSMLLPPQELMALGGIVLHWKKGNPVLIDAIAENLTLQQTLNRIGDISPSILVSICGFECFEEDIECLTEIKKRFPALKVILFGHYATLFSKEILEKHDFDYILLGEPDIIFSELYDVLTGTGSIEDVSGISYKNGKGIIVQSGETRIKNPDSLPMPAYEFLDANKYFEPFLKKPLGLIQSARGCPYSCNYCVRSYGRRLTYRTSQQIIDEIVFLKKHHGIKSLRFIDDTFTVNSKRVIEICQQIIEMKLDIEWTCLSRPDSLTEEMLPWMQQAGCKRIYFGIESGSPKVLRYLDKELDLTLSLKNLNLCKGYGIETLGFFIVGAPIEEDADLEMSIQFAIDAKLDYIIISTLIPYPGTPLFEKLKEKVNFSVLPYKNEWKDKTLTERSKQREKYFYSRFYFRNNYVAQNIKRMITSPVEFVDNFFKLITFMLKKPTVNKRKNFI